MRMLVAVVALSLCMPAWAEAYRLDAGVQASGGSLKVEPVVTGPAGNTVRYEIEVRRDGKGTSNSSQSGRARIDESGRAKLASSAVSLQPGERYEVEITLYKGQRVVAREVVAHP